jgi:hypothetical protein
MRCAEEWADSMDVELHRVEFQRGLLIPEGAIDPPQALMGWSHL